MSIHGTTARLITLLSFIPAAALAAEPSHRPMPEMHGRCSNYAWDLKKEFALWNESSTAITATPNAAKAPREPIEKRLRVALGSERLMKFQAKPRRPTPPDMSSFGGYISFEVPRDSTYRIAAGSRLWFEVVPAGSHKAVDASAFEMQTGCETINKVVAFPLKAGTRYLLQISRSSVSNADFLITPAVN